MALPNPIIDQLLDKTRDLPSLPWPVLEAIKIAGDPDSSTGCLAEAISVDQALAARVLKIANSAYYGLPQEVASLQDAVMLLGKASVRNLALLAATHTWFTSFPSDDAEHPISLWEHSVGVAAGSQAIAMKFDPRLVDEAFCAGLLHNIGKTVFAIWMKDKVASIIRQANRQHVPIYKIERKMFGYDHTEVGYALASRWNLPPRLLEAIRFHHTPDASGNTNVLTDIVHVADYVIRALGIGNLGDQMLAEVSSGALDRLRISTPAQVDELMIIFPERFKAATAMMEAA